MASLYERKNSPYFWIKFRDQHGHIRQESTRCRVGVAPDVRRARQMEAEKTLEEVSRGERRHGEGWIWVQDFLQVRYQSSQVSLERYNSAWRTIKLFLDERKIESPSHLMRQHCFDYVAWRQRPDKGKGKYKVRHNTALLELKTLRLIMQEAVERGIVTGNPCVKLGIKKEKPRSKPELTPEDCEAIRAGFDTVADPLEREMLTNSFEIARYQGCRLTETRLNPQTDVHLNGESSTIRFRAKGGREFATILHPKLVPLFERLRREGRRETWKVPEGRGRQWASSCWWRFLDRLGLHAKGVCFHSTRVTVVTELARNNVPLSKAKGYVGHASSTVHEIYQRLRPDDLSDCTRVVG